MDQALIANLLMAGSFIVFITIYVVNSKNAAKLLGGKLEFIDASLEDFKAELKELQKVIVQQALQSEQINNLDRRVTEGFKTMGDRSIVEGKRIDSLEEDLRRLSR